ncbi:MAG: DUF1492 domain-containing protein [Syntrophomonadaceae bacterium]|jgi:DNA-directed RNA polymerase specialized sigma subunit|nr:DUF1492 domain-containing protein [Syntrophomonadaceae bacterium]NLN84465.1 DUF1492 domain-containing protein [Bacillota bacterium]
METLNSYKTRPLLAERATDEAQRWSALSTTFSYILTAADMEKIQDIIKSLNEEAARCLAELEETMGKIEAADELSAQLLRLRYLKGLTWDEVADQMNYSLRQVFRLRKRAQEFLN